MRIAIAGPGARISRVADLIKRADPDCRFLAYVDPTRRPPG